MSMTMHEHKTLQTDIKEHLREIERDLDYRRTAQATEVKAQLLQAKSTALLALVELAKD